MMKIIKILEITGMALMLTVMSNQLLAQSNQKPNIVFIEVDDLTAKYVGAFGAEFAKTPNVDKLAKDGVLFENAVVQGMQCGPSRNSLMSALYPHNLGFYYNGQLSALPKNCWTIGQGLQAEGYHTEWVGKCHVKPGKAPGKYATKIEGKDAAMRVNMGFDYVMQSIGRVVALRMGNKLATQGLPWKTGEDAYGDFLNKNGLLDTFLKEGGNVPTSLNGDSEYMDGYFTSVALERLNSYNEEAPFFLWLNYSCPHGPFDVPQKWHDMFNYKDMPIPIAKGSEEYDVPEKLLPHKDNSKSIEEIQKYRAAYCATISYMDHQVGRVVDFIRSSNKFKDNTIIVFFSDHGLMTGDHGLKHKSTLFKEILNPSLIINYPKGFSPKRIDAPVELLDLGKTVIDIAGASQDNLDKCPNGFSLLPLLTGKGDYERNGVAFGEVEFYRTAVCKSYKLIDSDVTPPLLFNVNDDKKEIIDYSTMKPEVVAVLKASIDKWIDETGEIKPAGFYKSGSKKKNK